VSCSYGKTESLRSSCRKPWKRALKEGMISLRISGVEKIKQGITTIEEVLRETVA